MNEERVNRMRGFARGRIWSEIVTGGGGRGVVCHVFKLITKIYDWDRKLEIEF